MTSCVFRAVWPTYLARPRTVHLHKLALRQRQWRRKGRQAAGPLSSCSCRGFEKYHAGTWGVGRPFCSRRPDFDEVNEAFDLLLHRREAHERIELRHQLVQINFGAPERPGHRRDGGAFPGPLAFRPFGRAPRRSSHAQGVDGHFRLFHARAAARRRRARAPLINTASAALTSPSRRRHNRMFVSIRTNTGCCPCPCARRSPPGSENSGGVPPLLRRPRSDPSHWASRPRVQPVCGVDVFLRHGGRAAQSRRAVRDKLVQRRRKRGRPPGKASVLAT